MAAFPLYIDMTGRRVTVVGGGTVALRKIRILADFGADIHVFSREFHPELLDMAQKGQIFCEQREFLIHQSGENMEEMEESGEAGPREAFDKTDEDCLKSAFMVICAVDDANLSRAVVQYCNDHRIWVDCANSGEDSTFFFPSVIRRENVVIGVSTSGGAPALSRYLRERIEEVLPPCCGELEQKLRKKRAELKQTDLSEQEKRRILRDIILQDTEI